MSPSLSSSRVAEALVRAGHHGFADRFERTGPYSPYAAATIAISRQVGARGTSVGRAVGKLLDWPVYDQELLHRVAHEMHLPINRVAGVDEKPMSWLQECFQSMSSASQVTEDAYVHHLVEVLHLLGARGKCVLVGRGAAHALPPPSTLRVRMIAPLEDRISFMRQELHLSHDAAERFVVQTEQERTKFIRDHFLKDPDDPENYDLVLNASRISVDACAALIIEALRRMQEG